MMRRSSTKNQEVRRQKSSSSGHSLRLIHVDPETADQHARKAASQAFVRARERSMVDSPMWPPPRNKANPVVDTSRDVVNNGQVQKQHSVRFVKPKPPPRCSSRSETEAQSTPTKPSKAGSVARDKRVSQHCPVRNYSAAGMVSAAKGTAGDYISAIISGEEYYTPKDDIASAPSSYRRLRKSRSMWSGQVPAAVFDLPGVGRFSPTRCDRSTPAELRSPRSMSFLRGDRRSSDADADMHMYLYHRISTGEHMFSKGKEVIRVATQSSLSCRYGHQYLGKPLRKTMRPVDVNDKFLSSRTISKNNGLKSKARKASQRIKTKMMSLFRIGRTQSEDSGLPPQQISAERTHVTKMDLVDDNIDYSFYGSSDVEEAALSQVASGVPSLNPVPFEQQLHSRRGSLENIRSQRKPSDEKSRVTSWTNSDTNTLATVLSQRTGLNEQPQTVTEDRGVLLSPIELRDQNIKTLRSQYDTDAVNRSTTTCTAESSSSGQRIYSALMKRFSRSEPVSEALISQKQSLETSIPESTPQRSVSSNNETVEKSSSSDLVTVKSGPLSSATSPDVFQNAFTGSSHSTARNQSYPPPRSDESYLLAPRSTQTMLSPRSWSECRIGPPTPARILSTRSSAFFGSPECHLFRTQSPYRRAVQGSMRAATARESPTFPEFNPWMRSLNSLPICCTSNVNDSKAYNKTAYTESIYSSMGSVTMKNSTSSLPIVANSPYLPTTHGEAMIFPDQPEIKLNPLAINRATLSTSSLECKSWLSANTYKLERLSLSCNTGTEPVDSEVLKTIQCSRRVRESDRCNEERRGLGGEIPTASLSEDRRPQSMRTSPIKTTDSSSLHPRLDDNRGSSCEKENLIPSTSTILPDNVRFPNTTAPRNGHANDGLQISREINLPVSKFHESPSASCSHSILETQPENSTTPTRGLAERKSTWNSFINPTTCADIQQAVDCQFGSLENETPISGPALRSTVSCGNNITNDGKRNKGSSGLVLMEDGGRRSTGSDRMVRLFLNSRGIRAKENDYSDAFL
ncbi:hypothetical protein BX600DRAFT_541791 [Xylariales sp. PMI_506]|nr:hypothetical protein BX600DRAFT_541791 [Xylariales sp. PMI_506]